MSNRGSFDYVELSGSLQISKWRGNGCVRIPQMNSAL
jgi:hypothetical protein